MKTESVEYDIKLTERGPTSCEWKVWPKAGPPAAMGVEKNRDSALKAAERAKVRLEAKAAKNDL